MKTNQLKIHSQEYMETMARLMSEALESPEGMRALAAAIAAPIEQEIKRKEISSLLLTKHTLPKGERPVYQKKPTVKAHWISKDGDAQEQEVGKDEVEFPTNRIHSNPMVDVSVLKNGNIGTLMDIQTSAAGGILLTASMPLDEIIIVPDEEVGKMPVRENLKTESIDQKTRFKTGWLVWSEIGQGITRPDIMAKVKLVP